MSERNLIRKMTREEKSASGWVGWCGGELYVTIDPEMPIEEVLHEVAVEVRRRKCGIAVVDNTYQNHRLVGFGYTEQGYHDTPNGPKLWLMVIEGDPILR